MTDSYGVDLIRTLGIGDSTPEPGDWVQLRCPSCSWQSPPSLVVDQPNGAWYAYKAIGDSWREHWREKHTPFAIQCVVTEPSVHV